MNYSQIRKMDISNGEGIGVSLFVSGCDLHCKDCFNSELWNFEAGKPFTAEVEEYFLNLADKPYINRISILGGEPLAHDNVMSVVYLLDHIKKRFGDSKKVWLYSGYTFEEITMDNVKSLALLNADVLVDGRFDTNKKDMNLQFRGSSNQRIIDLNKTFHEEKLALKLFGR